MELTEILIPVAIFAGLGVALGILLAVASRVFAVKTDERVGQIAETLPGANCGGCGYSGCAALAEAIVKGEAPANACRAGGEACAARIGEIMGVAVHAQTPVRARVLCSGSCGRAKAKCVCEGVQDCFAADRMCGGGKLCPDGCMGFGSCVAACRYDALHVVDGVATVDPARCTGCGACAQICPRHLIVLVPVTARYCVVCSSHESGAQTRAACDAGCIGCRICEKNCPADAIHVVNNCAVIDYDRCTSCGLCASKCPRKVITLCEERKTLENPAF